jgi:hypothetical protein
LADVAFWQIVFPGFGVKLSAVILAGPTVLSAVAACPPHDGRKTTLVDQCCKRSQKIGRSHHRHRPSRDIFSRRAAGTRDLVIARYAATSFFDQLNSVWLIHMRCRMTASLRARRRLWPFAVHFAWRAIPIETGRTGALRAGGLAVGLPGSFAGLLAAWLREGCAFSAHPFSSVDFTSFFGDQGFAFASKRVTDGTGSSG